MNSTTMTAIRPCVRPLRSGDGGGGWSDGPPGAMSACPPSHLLHRCVSGSAALAPDPPVTAMTPATADVEDAGPVTRAARLHGGAHLRRPPLPIHSYLPYRTAAA